MQNILVTGGAGYIGSHMVWDLLQHDLNPIILDNFSNSSRRNLDYLSHHLNKKLTIFDLDVRNISELPKDLEIDAVIHFAAFKSVAESIKDPMKYYENNTEGTLKVVEWMHQKGVKNLIFSSTAAVYSPDDNPPITEQSKTDPASAYGDSKLLSEKFIAEACKEYGSNAVALRYFNVAGNLPNGEMGDEAKVPSAIIPRLITSALGLQDFQFEILGDDYDTRDGSTIRDFVHVLDLVRAHRLALEYLSSSPGFHIFNLGSENGVTMKEVVATFEKVTGKKMGYKIGPRREGDIPVSIADASLAKSELNWQPEFNLEQMIESMWKWYSSWKYANRN